MAFISVTLTGEQWDICLQALAVAQDRYEEFVQEHEAELAQCLIEEHSKYRDVERAVQISVANQISPSAMAEHQTLENHHMVYTDGWFTVEAPVVAPAEFNAYSGHGGGGPNRVSGGGNGGTDYTVL